MESDTGTPYYVIVLMTMIIWAVTRGVVFNTFSHAGKVVPVFTLGVCFRLGLLATIALYMYNPQMDAKIVGLEKYTDRERRRYARVLGWAAVSLTMIMVLRCVDWVGDKATVAYHIVTNKRRGGSSEGQNVSDERAVPPPQSLTVRGRRPTVATADGTVKQKDASPDRE